MKWSYSDSRTFGQCQRQWGFKRRVAFAKSTDPFRREAYLLSKLQTLAQWRGGIIDYVISQAVIPVLRQGRLPDRDRVLRAARECYENQRAFALAHRMWEPGLKVGDYNGGFAAFYDLEYGTAPNEERLANCWNEIEQALSTLLGMRDLLEPLRSAVALLDQRTLSLPFGGMSLTARPDLIALYRDIPPKVIDWKAHAYMQTAARGQLTLCAILLTGAPPTRTSGSTPEIGTLWISRCAKRSCCATKYTTTNSNRMRSMSPGRRSARASWRCSTPQGKRAQSLISRSCPWRDAPRRASDAISAGCVGRR